MAGSYDLESRLVALQLMHFPHSEYNDLQIHKELPALCCVDMLDVCTADNHLTALAFAQQSRRFPIDALLRYSCKKHLSAATLSLFLHTWLDRVTLSTDNMYAMAFIQPQADTALQNILLVSDMCMLQWL